MSTSLAQHHVYCYRAFMRISAEVPVSTVHHDSLQEEFDKYKLWAGNVGAAHSGKIYELSLDYRLREAPFYKEQVSKLLEILARQANKTADLLTGSRTPFEQRSSDTESDTNSHTSTVEEDSPWELSSDSEAEIATIPNGKAADQPSSSQSISTPEGCPENFPPGNGDYLHGSAIKELDQLLESIQVAVTCLYKLPLRKPASIDRLGDQTVQNVLCFGPFDHLYVQEKIPSLHPEVSARLAEMITRRRQLLLYRTKHRDRLRTDANAPTPQAMSYAERESSQINVPVKELVEYRPCASSGAPSLRESNRTTIKSKATTMRPEDMQQAGLDTLLAPSVAESDSKTSIVACEFTRDIRIEVPPRPKDQDGSGSSRFECKYCCLAVHIKSDKSWKKHVLNDLQPYVCTFPRCTHTKHSFENKEAWYRHETQFHRLEYFCNTVGHSPSSHPAEFELHMKEEHLGAFDPVHTPLNVFKRPSSSKGTCNLCFQVTENLKRHVSRHLEQVSLFALSRADFGAPDDEILLGSNSNAAQQSSVSSQYLDIEHTKSEASNTSSSVSRHKPAFVPSMVFDTAHVQDLDNSEIPETDETDWNFVTKKFSLAREGDADIAPLATTAVQTCPPAKKTFRHVGLALWALMTFRQMAAQREKKRRFSPYHRVGVMLFWIQPGIDDANAAWSKQVVGLREVFRYRYHYDVWEPQFSTALPLLAQIRTCLDGYFREFSKAGNLMIIYFEGFIHGKSVSQNAALYRAFLEVIHDYIQQSEADSILIMRAHRRINLENLLGSMETRSKLRGTQVLVFQSNSLETLHFSLDDWELWPHDTTAGLSFQMDYVSKTRGGKCTLYPSLEERSNCIRLLPLSTEQGIKTLQSRISLATMAEPVSTGIECDKCSKSVAGLPEYHYNCRFCHRGDFDLCEDCIAAGNWCLHESHQLVKRFIKPGRVINPPGAPRANLAIQPPPT